MKRWYVEPHFPQIGRHGAIRLIDLHVYWTTGDWVSVALALFGFGVTITRVVQPDVYGDGGVA